MIALYLIGMPGVGKTTLLNATCATKWGPFEACVGSGGVRWEDYGQGRMKIGDAEGTDRFPIGCGGAVLAWVAENRPARLVAEGVRFAEAQWFAGLRRLGYSVTVAMLTGSEALIRLRVRQRGRRHPAKTMDGVGMRIRTAAECADMRWTRDAGVPIGTMVEWIGQHPVWEVA